MESTQLHDKFGTTINVGDMLAGLYKIGDDTGIVVKTKYGFRVKDSDGDLLELSQCIDNGAYIKK